MRLTAYALITIKTANISLLHDYQGKHYVVNLVDTPGHVDFSGKVTRAMRSIDGAVIVIDAVEGVMAQTESVLRSAIAESVRPVLFINKIDRLIRELKLSPQQIRNRLNQIIEQTNILIAEALGNNSEQSWEVSSERNTVAFGSALHKWGFTVSQMENKNLRFINIIDFYKTNQIEDLATLLPIHEPILNMILENLPSPKKAQSYRIQTIWKGDLTSPAGKALQECNDDGPLIIGIIKIVTDPRHDHIAVGRLFSGTIRRGAMVKLYPKGIQSRVQRVTLFMGSRRVVVPELTAGNICGLVGLEKIEAGDTVTGLDLPQGMIPFEKITYINEPVVTIAIEPQRPRELPRLLSLLETMIKKDPNLIFYVNEKTGENILSGIGLLHLEITTNDIEKEGIQVIASDPIVLYRETPKKQIKLNQWIDSPNEKNKIKIAIRQHDKNTSFENQTIWFYDDRNNALYSLITKTLPEAVKEALISGFKWALERGPLCGEPVGSTIVQISDIQLSENLSEHNRVELMSMMKEAILTTFNKSGMTLLEPLYLIQVLVPNELLSEVTGVIVARRGEIENIDHKGSIVGITGIIPVSESFDLANTLRSKTSGRATWQTSFARWEVVPEARVETITKDIRKRKGWRNL